MASAADLTAAPHPRAGEILTDDARTFLADLHDRFEPRRCQLLEARSARRARIAAGELPGFLPETADVRSGDWTVAEPPKDLLDRRVELTGPAERKMMINALNSGASVFMADLEDAMSPTWDNLVTGQVNLRDAYRRTIELDQGGKQYRLADQIATLVVRPRGWHLPEGHALVGGQPISASLFDAGLTLFHNARAALDAGTGPYFYLPKIESHLEARLWADVFAHAEQTLGLDRGSIRATVLIEHVLAAFEMDEILYELRDHSAALNAGRWDYMFSVVKTFRSDPRYVLPDRARVTMTSPFLRAYTELLVQTCHRRGAHAIGGMSAFIPNRQRPDVTERALDQVRKDKEREAGDGFDGTWVANPDLIPVARAEFDRVLGEWPNQRHRQRPDVAVTPADLLAIDRTGGEVTTGGLRTNVDVALRYLSAWLTGTGAAAIHDLMEDAATAEISRTQVWQWLRHGAVTRAQVDTILADVSRELADLPRIDEARRVFESVALGEDLPEFLTLTAYQLLEES